MPKQVIVRPLGIITRPNKLGQYPPGALAQADGAWLRSLGVLESPTSWRTVTTLGSVSRAFAVADAKHVCFVYLSGSTWRLLYIKSDGTTYDQSLSSRISTSDIGSDGVVGLAIMRDRLIITTKVYTNVVDLSGSPASAPSTIRKCGILSPTMSSYTVSTGATDDSCMLPDGRHTASCTVIRRIYSDGYEIVSPPSAWVESVAYNVTGGLFYVGKYFYSPSLLDGDVIEVYRTRSQLTNESGGVFDPTNLGANMYQSLRFVRTTGVQTWIDRTLDSGLGEGLYTNTNVSGGAAAAYPPPQSYSCVQFRGHMFYLRYFSPALLKLRASVAWGTSVALSSGTVNTSGTATSGSNVVTAVADTTQIVVGMYAYMNGAIAYPARVTGTTATTVTLDQNATASLTDNFSLTDAIEFNGNVYEVSTPDDLDQVTYFDVDVVGAPLINPDVEPSSAYPTGQPDQGTPIRLRTTGDITIRATRGNRFVPQLPLLENDESPLVISGKWVDNGLVWSEENQPENCPSPNYAYVGTGVVYAAASTRDALWIFASDGLWRLSGTGGSVGDGYDWRIDPIDSTLIIAGPRALCVLRDMVYAYTSRGIVSVDGAGNVESISDAMIGDVLPGHAWDQTQTWTSSGSIWMTADDTNGEISLRDGSTSSWWTYNTETKAFTKVPPPTHSSSFHGVYSQRDECIYCIDSSGNVVASNGTGYSSMTLRFQPVTSKSDGSSHTQKHWQSVDVVCDAIQIATNVTFTPNGDSGLASTRSIATSSTAYQDESRVGFSVPRNSPAVANMLSVGVTVASSIYPVKLQSVAIEYEEFTDQRRKR